MKLEEIEIMDFRGLEHLKLDLRDELGRVTDRLPIVGPNTSGKTTILDAITLCLMPVTELVQFRKGLILTPSSLVRQGAVQARVCCTLRFADEELEAANDLFRRVDSPHQNKVPHSNRVTVSWEFPDRCGKHRTGSTRFDPPEAWRLLKGRVTAARSLDVPGVSPRAFRGMGGVFLFDQERTGLARKITRGEPMLRRQDGESDFASRHRGTRTAAPTDEFDPVARSRIDLRLSLLNLATCAQATQDPGATEKEDYEHLCALYEKVCRPHRIRGLYNTGQGLDMEFEGDHGVYRFDGLSSGQAMLLLLLLQFATKHIHRSIVLIDELELHLHPLWQDRLYYSLEELGKDNQYLFTTHSTHLRDVIGASCFHSTGDLEQRPAALTGA